MKYTLDEVLNLVHKVFQQEMPKILKEERQTWEQEIDSVTEQENGSCFECGSLGPCHRHHVVPRSLGGRNTVLLCEGCHGQVHGKHMLGHGRLTRAGLEKARRNGKTLGRKVGSSIPIEELLEKHKRVVRCIRNGDSVRKSAAFCGVSKGTVERVKKALAATTEPEFS